jgi:FkbM family methyltransferase
MTIKLPKMFNRQQSLRRLASSKPPLVRLADFNGAKFGVWIGANGAIEDHILQWSDWSSELLILSDYFIKPNTAVIEVGANIGFESLYYATKYPNCSVISYEPGNYGFTSLFKSKNYNKLSNLSVYKLGLGCERSKLDISSPTEASLNKGLGSFNKNCDIDSTYVSEPVEVIPLDEHYQGELPISLIKIDTQGFESQVLQGAQGLIEKYKPVIIFEFEDHYHANPAAVRCELSAGLKSSGYDFFTQKDGDLYPFNLAGEKTVHHDVIALPNS